MHIPSPREVIRNEEGRRKPWIGMFGCAEFESIAMRAVHWLAENGHDWSHPIPLTEIASEWENDHLHHQHGTFEDEFLVDGVLNERFLCAVARFDDDRRFRRVILDRDEITKILSWGGKPAGTCLVVFGDNPIIEETTVVNVAYDVMMHGWVVTLEHESFEPVPLGEVAPMMDERVVIQKRLVCESDEGIQLLKRAIEVLKNHPHESEEFAVGLEIAGFLGRWSSTDAKEAQPTV